MLQMAGNHCGETDLTGFIEATVMGPAIKASRRTMPPMAIPAKTPISLKPVDMLIITCIKKKVSGTSIINILKTSICGRVDPNSSFSGKRNKRIPPAANAPRICEIQQAGTSFHGIFIAKTKPIVTATFFAKSDDHSHDYESEGHRNAHMRHRGTRKLIDDNHTCTTKNQTKGSNGFGDITLFYHATKAT